MFVASIWGKINDLYVNSIGLLIIGGKRGRIGNHAWDINLTQSFSKDFLIVRIS